MLSKVFKVQQKPLWASGLADKAFTVLKFSNLFDEWCKIGLFDKKTVIVC